MSKRLEISSSVIHAFNNAQRYSTPYRYWIIENVLPQDIVDEIIELPWKAQNVGDDSGRREIHNDTRNYFGMQHRIDHTVCEEVSTAFQMRSTVDIIEQITNQSFNNKFLRIEYTQDKGNFWLEPHTDIGVKKFTMLIYLSKEESHSNLGTDLYEVKEVDRKDYSTYNHVGTAPFKSNNAVVFIPGDDTWHGFEPKYIEGVRKALIINYVDAEWRETSQLCFPNTPL